MKVISQLHSCKVISWYSVVHIRIMYVFRILWILQPLQFPALLYLYMTVAPLVDVYYV